MTGHSLPHRARRVLKRDVLCHEVRAEDIDATGAAGTLVLAEDILLVGIVVVGNDRPVLTDQLYALLALGNHHFLLIDALADEDTGRPRLAIVGHGINGCLNGGIVPAAVGSHHCMIHLVCRMENGDQTEREYC